MLRSVGVGLALVAVLLATGCRDEAGSDPARHTSKLTQDELGWIRAYSRWTFDFYDDEPAVGADAVAVCQRKVNQIGSAPSERLEDAADRIQTICPLVQQLGSLRHAQDELEYIDGLVLQYMRDEQRLQLRSDITDRSRADVALSGIASDVIGEPVEVRCWDEEDWSRVVREDNVWNDDSADPDDLMGWIDDYSDRIHLVLDVCNTIAAARTRDVTTLNLYDRIDAVEALETLLHEIGHFLESDASEAEVECTAIRSLPGFLGRFGVTGAAARELTELYRTEVYETLDDEYTEGGCPRTA